MANTNFSCSLDTWQDGDYGKNIHARMHYWRSGSYYYLDQTFPNPTMEIAGSSWSDSGFGNQVRAGVYVGSVYSTEYSKTVGGNGSYNVAFHARSGVRSDFYGDWSKSVSVTGFPTAPGTPSADNLTSDGTPNRAYSKVTSNGWGNNSSRRDFEIICNSSIKASDYNNSPASMYWTLPNESSNQNAGLVNTWYGRAVNNHVMWTDSGARYVATPSAPKLTITAGSGTNPQTTISATTTYRGGTQNSSTCDNGAMKRWQMGKMTSSQSGVPSFQLDSNNDTARTKTYTWAKSQFNSGTNYKFYVRAVNNYGGTSATFSSVIYCPTGVSATLNSSTTESLTIRGSVNYAGSVGSTSGGSIACYQLQWGSAENALNNTIGPQTSNSFTISNLTPGQKIYYRITAWNTYGLSNTSSINNSTTVPRYSPVIGNITFEPKSPGADVSIKIDHTGGLSLDELTITDLKVDWQAGSSSSPVWTNLVNLTGLNISAGETYLIEDLWTTDAPEEGIYNVRITASNGTDSTSTIEYLASPAPVTLSNVSLVSNQPVQIKATASTTNNLILPYKYVFKTEGGAGTRIRTFNSNNTSLTVTSPNYLLYDTTYTVTATIYNKLGLWCSTSSRSITTDKRVSWAFVSGNTTKDGVVSFATNSGLGNFQESGIIDVYYLTANALGDIDESSIGTSMDDMRLTFIAEPLHYRPANVASIEFTNGKRLSYELDSDADRYKFGIWTGDAITTVFFDGDNWQMNSYDFPAGYTISEITTPEGDNLNCSAAFSTTSLTNVPLPGQDTNNGGN